MTAQEYQYHSRVGRRQDELYLMAGGQPPGSGLVAGLVAAHNLDPYVAGSATLTPHPGLRMMGPEGNPDIGTGFTTGVVVP